METVTDLQHTGFTVTARESGRPDHASVASVTVTATWQGHRIPGHQWRLSVDVEGTRIERTDCFEVFEEVVDAATRMATKLHQAWARHADAESAFDQLVEELRS